MISGKFSSFSLLMNIQHLSYLYEKTHHSKNEQNILQFSDNSALILPKLPLFTHFCMR